MGVPGIILAEQDRGRISALIERGAKIVSGIGSMLSRLWWCLSPSELMVLRTISVYFGNGEPWLRIETA